VSNMPSTYRNPICIALALWIAVFASQLVMPQVCRAQSKSDTPQITQADRDAASKATVDRSPRISKNEEPSKTASSGPVDIDSADSKAKSVIPIDGAPLTDRERAMLELIRDLQERVAKLESQTPSSSQTRRFERRASPSADGAGTIKQPALAASTTPASASPVASLETSAANSIVRRHKQQICIEQRHNPSLPTTSPSLRKRHSTDEKKLWGKYTPNLGFKLVDTEHGDLSLSIYSYVRYLNQLGLDENYTDAFGNIKNVQRRQDMQLLKLQMKFLGWVINPKLRYFLYAWTSNANQGQGAQVCSGG
jgi:hypothetical protein